MSREEGFPQSRLGSFTSAEIEFVRGSADFIGLNHYTSVVCADGEPAGFDRPSFGADRGGNCYTPAEWEASSSSWLKVVPWGLRKILKWTKDEYNDFEIIITENGYSDTTGDMDDCPRIKYLNVRIWFYQFSSVNKIIAGF